MTTQALDKVNTCLDALAVHVRTMTNKLLPADNQYIPELVTAGNLSSVFADGFVYRNGTDTGTLVKDGLLTQQFFATDTGSVHEQASAKIPDGFRTYTVTQKMKFADDFDAVRGGKCGFGLMGKGAITSGGSTDVRGWSERFMFRPSKKPGHIILVLYTYQVNRNFSNGKTWGDDNFIAELPLGKWFEVSKTITLNSSASAKDGAMQASINGEQTLYKDGVQWQGEGAPGDYMQAEYTAFFGGNDSSWAPSKVERMWIKDVVYRWE